MRRRKFLTLLGGAAAAWPLAARAHEQSLPLIGFMGVGPFAGPDIRRGLADNGFVQGRDFRAEYRWAEFDPKQMAAQAADLVQHGASVIVTIAQSEALAAKAATQTIPIIFMTGADPVEIGLVESINRPGGNLTGFYGLGTGLVAKRLEVLKELVPTANSIAYLSNPTDAATTEIETRELQVAARILGVKLIFLKAGNALELVGAFETLAQEHADALIVGGTLLFFVNRDELGTLSASYKVPTIYAAREYAESGGLASFGTRGSDGRYLSGVYASRILKGEKPSELPVQQITKTELILNLQTAKALGLTVPPTLLARADEVIE
jgi:putative tryptophan/tyrosine transport system substrate-binding protein